ncbi:hypothetical protein NW759_012361 [Fusarium solani]|nr:hypothetical protein NW759_012361 [Fusarium solani]
MILSLTSPGIQGISSIELAKEVATRANNEIAAAISNNTVRFGAFAALSMHNATQVALELRRCVEDLGFHGALLNDFRQACADNNTLHFYDSLEYDPFWQMAVDLDARLCACALDTWAFASIRCYPFQSCRWPVHKWMEYLIGSLL